VKRVVTNKAGSEAYGWGTKCNVGVEGVCSCTVVVDADEEVVEELDSSWCEELIAVSKVSSNCWFEGSSFLVSDFADIVAPVYGF
jgi:hypothetical protein